MSFTQRLTAFLDAHARVVFAGLTLVYALLQWVYIVRLPLAMDEFAGAGSVFALASGIPYRDFVPYKNVLGYYAQLGPLLLTSDTWMGLMAVKLATAAFNSTALYAAMRWLRRRFRPAAVCLGALVFVCMSTFLERSSALRVDMLTGWVGLFSLLALLDRRIVLAGALAGVSFLVSQKGAGYMLCGGLALAAWLAARPSRAALRDAALFTAAALAPIAVYVGLFGAIAGFRWVSYNMFVRHGDIALTEMYDLSRYWFQTVVRNPYFYAASVLGLGALYVQRRTDSEAGFSGFALFVYGGGLLALSIWHKQPWPYFFVLLVPTLLVVVVAWLDMELRRPRGLSVAGLALLLVVGVAFPLRRVPVVLERDSGFQQHMVELAEAILDEGEPYVVGVDMLRDHPQPVTEMAWLDKRHKRRLRKMDANVIVARLRAAPPKLLIRNYRLRRLPRPIDRFLRDNYRRLHGALHIYAPPIDLERQTVEIHYGGRYRVRGNAALVLDGQTVEPDEAVDLEPGRHTAVTQSATHLQLSPPRIDDLLDPAYEKQAKLFPDVYDY